MKGEMVRIQNMQSALKKIEMMELYMQIEHTYKTEYCNHPTWGTSLLKCVPSTWVVIVGVYPLWFLVHLVIGQKFFLYVITHVLLLYVTKYWIILSLYDVNISNCLYFTLRIIETLMYTTTKTQIFFSCRNMIVNVIIN